MYAVMTNKVFTSGDSHSFEIANEFVGNLLMKNVANITGISSESGA